MSRSERYIPPSEEELERQQQAIEAARQCDEERAAQYRAGLKKMKKADLVELLLRIAQESKASEWILEQELNQEKPIDLVTHDIEIAIDLATQVDESQLDHNFDYDWRAYEAVQRGLSQLIEKGCTEEAKSLSLMLMQKGSYQMECSDEGLMCEEIEDCLRPVISAAAASPDSATWAVEMLRRDCVGVICTRELTGLARMPPGD